MKRLMLIAVAAFLFSSNLIAASQCAYFKLSSGQKVQSTIPNKNEAILLKVNSIIASSFYCMKQKDNSYKCDGDNDAGSLIFKKTLVEVRSLHIGNPDKKMFHYSQIKSPKVVSFDRRPCSL